MIAKPSPGAPQDRLSCALKHITSLSSAIPSTFCSLSLVFCVQNGARCTCRYCGPVFSAASPARGMVSQPRRLCLCPILTAYAFRLPQWEGVQRKWYYVQRATGKSQWEIPTEPVVLTPSTTPTSIGTGPSQAPPSRPSTNSPQAVVPGNTLMGRIGSAVESARTSVGNRAHCVCTSIGRVALMAG